VATQKQIQANRLNSRKSTGPRTLQGKSIVSMNSLRHGMRASAIALPDENEERFQPLCDELQAEMALLEKIAIACDIYTGQNQETMLEPIARFQERFERAFFRALTD
jgi:hypothetical protein